MKEKLPLSKLLDDHEWVLATLTAAKLTGAHVAIVACERLDHSRYYADTYEDTLSFYTTLVAIRDGRA